MKACIAVWHVPSATKLIPKQERFFLSTFKLSKLANETRHLGRHLLAATELKSGFHEREVYRNKLRFLLLSVFEKATTGGVIVLPSSCRRVSDLLGQHLYSQCRKVRQ